MKKALTFLKVRRISQSHISLLEKMVNRMENNWIVDTLRSLQIFSRHQRIVSLHLIRQPQRLNHFSFSNQNLNYFLKYKKKPY